MIRWYPMVSPMVSPFLADTAGAPVAAELQVPPRRLHLWLTGDEPRWAWGFTTGRVLTRLNQWPNIWPKSSKIYIILYSLQIQYPVHLCISLYSISSSVQNDGLSKLELSSGSANHFWSLNNGSQQPGLTFLPSRQEFMLPFKICQPFSGFEAWPQETGNTSYRCTIDFDGQLLLVQQNPKIWVGPLMVPSTCCMDWCCLHWPLIPWSLIVAAPSPAFQPQQDASRYAGAKLGPLNCSHLAVLWDLSKWKGSEALTNLPGIDMNRLYNIILYIYIYDCIIQLLWISGFHQLSPNETTQNRTWFSHGFPIFRGITLFRWRAGPAACPLLWWTHLHCCMTPGWAALQRYPMVPNLQKSGALIHDVIHDDVAEVWWLLVAQILQEFKPTNQSWKDTPEGPQSMEASLTHFSRCPLVC